MHEDLIRRLRNRSATQPENFGLDEEAADALEAMQADIHSCHPNCARAGCVNERLRAEVEALRADAERWKALYRRAINEANGLTNYVEDRPELYSAEKRIAAIENAARSGKTT